MALPTNSLRGSLAASAALCLLSLPLLCVLSGCALIASPPPAPEPTNTVPIDLREQAAASVAAGVELNVAAAEAMQPVLVSDYSSLEGAAVAVTDGIFSCLVLGNVPLSDELKAEAFTSELWEESVPRELQLRQVFDTCMGNYIDFDSPDLGDYADQLYSLNTQIVIKQFADIEVSILPSELDALQVLPDRGRIQIYRTFLVDVPDRPETNLETQLSVILTTAPNGELRVSDVVR